MKERRHVMSDDSPTKPATKEVDLTGLERSLWPFEGKM